MPDVFRCGECGHESNSWALVCPRCGTQASAQVVAGASPSGVDAVSQSTAINSLDAIDSRALFRYTSGFTSLDNALGDGFIKGAVTLLAGAPGAGKSTLALQSAAHISLDHKTLFVSGEEPLDRLALRARRLHLDVSRLDAVSDTEMLALARIVRRERYGFVVVDSLHTLHNERLRSRPGSPSQLIACAQSCVRLAQSVNCAWLLIGHVTKQNFLSGPRSVEHIVDVMLTFHPKGAKRILTATKNRFGPALAPYTLKMTKKGLIDVA